MKTKERKSRAEYMRLYRKEHPEYRLKKLERQRSPENKLKFKKRYGPKAAERRREMRKFVFEIKKTLQCERCGFDKHPAALQFHHKDPLEKDMSIKNLCNRKSRERILEEIKKCEVLCANCHQIFHFEEKPDSDFYLSKDN